MKIGYDAKRAFFNNTGLGNYSRWLIKAMAGYYPDSSWYLYTPKAKANNRLGFLSHHNNISVKTPQSGLFTSWWRSKGIVDDLKRDGIEVYHGLSHELPSGIGASGVKCVVTVHDLIFMRYPGQFGWFNYYIYLAKLRYACKVAGRIIAISKKTRDDLTQLLHINPEKIEVIYQNCDPVFGIIQTPGQKSAVKTKYNLPGKFLLNVGTIEERKNLLLIAKALSSVNNNIPLVIVGKPTKYTRQVKAYLAAHNLTGRVIFLTDVTFTELAAVYQLASVFIYPSRYEGFGIPVLEALNSGVPVIAATGSCLEEAGGPGSIYINPDDDAALSAQVNRLMADENLRQAMIARGREHAACFNDDKLALQLMQLYTNTLNHA